MGRRRLTPPQLRVGEALGGDKRAQAMYPEIAVRSQTGVGAEPSSVVEERVPAAV
jgi:hypothetical protein